MLLDLLRPSSRSRGRAASHSSPATPWRGTGTELPHPRTSLHRIASGACAETSGRALLGRAGLADGAPRSVTDLEQVPTLVRRASGAAAARACWRACARARAAARQLVRRWEDAELRLIAVGVNSLASKSGQKVLAVGIPLAAAQLMGLGREARAYAVPLEAQGEASSHHPRKPAGGTGADALHAARRLALCLLAAVAREALLAARAAFLGLLFLPALLSSPALWCGEGRARRLAAPGLRHARPLRPRLHQVGAVGGHPP